MYSKLLQEGAVVATKAYFPPPLVAELNVKFILTTIQKLNSLGSEFSSQGHFHTLQLLNIPQFLFCQVVRLKTAPRCNFSHTE